MKPRALCLVPRCGK